MSDEVINDIFSSITPSNWSYPFRRRIIGFKASLHETPSGNQQVISHTTHDRLRYILNLRVLDRVDRDEVFDFYRARRGMQDDFLIKDEMHSRVARNSIGTGDGVETEFQLKELVDTVTFARWDIIASPAPQIWVNTVLKSTPGDYSIDFTSSGVVTFVVAPPNTHDIEAAFDFYRRVRFTSQYDDIEQEYEDNNIENLTMDEVKVVVA